MPTSAELDETLKLDGQDRFVARKAIVVIARKLIRLIYKIIKGTRTYTEYGAEYFYARLNERMANKKLQSNTTTVA